MYWVERIPYHIKKKYNMKRILNLELLSKKQYDDVLKNYQFAYDVEMSGKERSELTEKRIRTIMSIDRPKTTEYDLFFEQTRFELKQAEGYMSSPKFQQVKPSFYPYIICLLNYKDKSVWYLLETKNISKKSGAANVEKGKLPLQKQHAKSIDEGQITLTKRFYDFAIELGEYEPIIYHKDDLNLSEKSVKKVFKKISSILNK